MNPFILCLFARLRLSARLFAGAFALSVLSVSSSFAASDGLSGSVSHAVTHSSLEGAVVELSELGLRTFTDPAGQFSFGSLPAGEHVVRVSYVGLDSSEKRVRVATDGRASVSFALNSEVYTMTAFEVTGEPEGNAVSITRQRNADNLMNVVAIDAYGNVADGNIGNFMQRMPGVGVILESGDVVGFGVRGTPSEMSSLNVDGVRSSSAVAGFSPQGDRAAIVDQIPAEFIKEIELTKALTPDQPADAIGGAANLVTKSALDFNRPVLTYRAGLNLNLLRRSERGNWLPTGAFTYLTRLGAERKLGVALSASFTQTSNPRDRIEIRRTASDGLVSRARTLNDLPTRTRAGMGLKFNYRFDETFDVYLNIQYTYYDFDSERIDWDVTASGANRVADFSVRSRAQIKGGLQPRTTGNALSAGIALGYTDDYTEMLHANFLNRAAHESRISHAYKIDAGAKKLLGGGQTLTVRASFNPSEYRSDFRAVDGTLTGRFGAAVDSTDRERPRYLHTYGESISFGGDLSRYTGRYLQNYDRSEEEMLNLAADYEKVFSQLRYPVQLKTGAVWRQQYRNLDTRRPSWTLNNPGGLARYRKAEPGYGLMNGLYEARDELDFRLAARDFAENPEWFSYVPGTDTYNEVTEDVYAAYVMGRLQLRRLGVVTGVRFEQTDVLADGNLVDPRQPNVARISRASRYREYYPSLHLRHNPAKDLILRASVSTGSARPALNQLYTRTVVTYRDDDTGTVSQNDPGLRPQFSRNYDLSVEYYLKPVGVLSAGWFYKDISDFIGRETRTIGEGADNGFGGDWAGFTLSTSRNFGSANVQGYELSYSQELRALPKPFNSLSIFANHTRTRTAGDYGENTDELVRFIPRTTNAGLSWRLSPFQVRVAYNYNGGYLFAYHADPYQRRRVDSVGTWDLNLQYRFSQKLNVFVDVNNVFDDWASFYTATDRSRIYIADAYGTRISAGISGRF